MNENLLEFVKNRLRFSIYYKYIKFVRDLKRKPLSDLADFNKLLDGEFREITEYT